MKHIKTFESFLNEAKLPMQPDWLNDYWYNELKKSASNNRGPLGNPIGDSIKGFERFLDGAQYISAQMGYTSDKIKMTKDIIYWLGDLFAEVNAISADEMKKHIDTNLNSYKKVRSQSAEQLRKENKKRWA